MKSRLNFEERWKRDAEKRKKKQEEYAAMSPREKSLYLLEGVNRELSKISDVDFSCHAGRETCVECAISEITNFVRDGWKETPKRSEKELKEELNRCVKEIDDLWKKDNDEKCLEIVDIGGWMIRRKKNEQ